MVYPLLLPLMRTPRLPVVDRTDSHADLNELVRFAERRNLVSARVPSHFRRILPLWMTSHARYLLRFRWHVWLLLKNAVLNLNFKFVTLKFADMWQIPRNWVTLEKLIVAYIMVVESSSFMWADASLSYLLRHVTGPCSNWDKSTHLKSRLFNIHLNHLIGTPTNAHT